MNKKPIKKSHRKKIKNKKKIPVRGFQMSVYDPNMFSYYSKKNQNSKKKSKKKSPKPINYFEFDELVDRGYKISDNKSKYKSSYKLPKQKNKSKKIPKQSDVNYENLDMRQTITSYDLANIDTLMKRKSKKRKSNKRKSKNKKSFFFRKNKK
tara:strand:+ start:10 stop:465 length:456 start_codon:yes stop_codon:yes gene_type:complete